MITERGVLLAGLNLLLLALGVVGGVSAQRIYLSRDRFDVTIEADTVPSGGIPITLRSVETVVPFQPNVPFKASVSTTHLPANGPRFLLVTPARGTTPANVALGLDPLVVPFLAPGVYAGTFGYLIDAPGDPSGAGGFYTLRVTRPPPPAITAVFNAASLKPSIAPGTVVSIFGTHLGSPALSAKPDEVGAYPTDFGNSTVTFNGVAAPLTYVGNSQINAIVPNDVAGQSSARVVIRHHSQTSAEFVVPMRETAPAIFTATQDGNGQGAILQTARGNGAMITLNSADNPVERGAAIIVYATGSGLWNQDVRAGQVLLAPQWPPEIVPRAAVSMTIGGKIAQILYAGGAPNMAGVIQVNATVPDDVLPGAQVVGLTVGGGSNLQQQQVTVAVR